MAILRYLPSAQFASIALSLALAGGLVLGAERFVAYQKTPKESGVAVAPTAAPPRDPLRQSSSEASWKAALANVQTGQAEAPEAPSEDTLSELREAAQSSNLTESVARTLLINFSAARAEGLGEDLPTQDKLVAEALAQSAGDARSTYALGDLTLSAPGSTAVRTWANSVMETLLANREASVSDAYTAFAHFIDSGDKAQLQKLKSTGDAYRLLAQRFVEESVPETFAPLHLAVANNFAAMAGGLDGMQAVAEDPLRGLAGLQQFQSLEEETTRVLTSIAGQLNKSGILFSKDEPGYTWSVFLSP